MGREAEIFNDAAGKYDEFTKRSRYFSIGWIAEHIHDLEGLSACRVLDLGCGTGLNVKALSDHRAGIRADGVDISPKMLEYARATGRYERLYTHNLNEPLLDLQSETFDLVVAFGFLEILSRIHVCLSECHRVLKLNGNLWAAFRRFEPEDDASPPRQTSFNGMTITGYSAGEILQMMRVLGMRVVALEPVDGFITATGFAYPYYVLQAQRI
jgi:predicted TPR repeat methyltransferase